MATVDDIEEGFYRYPDLKAKKYVSSRSDLHDKQKKLGFPLPAKPSPKVALSLKTEVHAWWLAILAKRDAELACKHIEPAQAAEADAVCHARLISQGMSRDAKRDDKPRKGIQRQGTTVDKHIGRTA
jgi:hypothetical protein